MTLRTLNYGNYGIFLIMGNAGFCPSAVHTESKALRTHVLRLLGLKTILYEAFGPFGALGS